MEIKDVENLAELAKIELSDEEKTKILNDMEGILAYVKQIEEVEVPDFIPEYNHKNEWREDTVREQVVDRDPIINQFPDKQEDFLKVKKIL